MKWERWLKVASLLSAFFIADYPLISQADNLNISQVDNLKSFLRSSKIEVGGWIHGGATFNPSQSDGYNGPVIFADQANQFQLNQFNLFLQRSVPSEGKAWHFGGRFGFMFGTDPIFTQAFGVPTFDVNSGEELKRSNWDLDLCCASTKTYGIAFPRQVVPSAYREGRLPAGGYLH